MKLVVKVRRVFLRVAMALFALTLLTYSTNHHIPSLLLWAEKGIAPEIHWFKAAKLGSEQASQMLIDHAREQKQLHWLALLADQNIAEAQYSLAMLTQSKSIRSRMLSLAAQQDHLGALFEIGQSSPDEGSKTRAFTRAAELGHQPSQYALYQWYWMQEEYGLALPWLKQVAKTHGPSTLLLARYLWKSEQRKEAKDGFSLAEQLGEKEARQYLSLIKRYWKKSPNKHANHENWVTRQCAMKLQFVANNLESMKQATEFKKQFLKDKRLQSLPICVNEPVWFDSNKLACEHFAVNDYRLSCDVSTLAKSFQPNDFTHVVIFAEQGKANVNNGVMYLDLADKYSVFVHELAHFAGFVDEYPVSDGLAERICEPNQSHPNILVRSLPKQRDTEQLTEEEIEEGFFNDVDTLEEQRNEPELDISYWQQFSNSLAMIKARTCNNHPNQAYKFVGKMTFMEFHDQEYIPNMYLNIWRSRLNSPEVLVPASLNIAHALEDKGQFNRAEKWRAHFIEFRKGIRK